MKSFLLVSFCFVSLLLVTSVHGEEPAHFLIDGPYGSYHKSVERWKESATRQKLMGLTYLGRLPGNGFTDPQHRNKARDTLIFVPFTLSLEKKVEIIYFLHGHGGFGKRDFEVRLIPSIKRMMKQGRNFVLIAPEFPWSANTTTPRGRQSQAWRDEDGTTLVRFFLYMRQVLHAGFEIPVFDMKPRVTIVAHSGGGGALKTLAKEKLLVALRPDVIVMSEASYGTWADQVWDHYVKDHPECKLVFFLLKGGEPYKRTQRLLKRIGDTPREIGIKIYKSPRYSHVKIGDHSLVGSAEFVYEQ